MSAVWSGDDISAEPIETWLILMLAAGGTTVTAGGMWWVHVANLVAVGLLMLLLAAACSFGNCVIRARRNAETRARRERLRQIKRGTLHPIDPFVCPVQPDEFRWWDDPFIK
jgi:hypothetical protein